MTNRPPSSRLDRTVRAATIAAALLVLAVLGIAVVWRPTISRWIANEVAPIGGPFELVSYDGTAFTRDDLLGHPHILYFGFTYCPDLCPTTLFLLANIVESLGEEADKLKVVFVSVDPERDTIDVLKDYVTAFNADFIGLTGSPEAIAEAAKVYRVYYKKVDLEGDDYTYDHTASAFLFNADGTYIDAIAHDESETSARNKIESLLAHSH